MDKENQIQELESQIQEIEKNSFFSKNKDFETDLIELNKRKNDYLLEIRSRDLFRTILNFLKNDLELTISEPGETPREDEIKAFYDLTGKVWFKGHYMDVFDDKKENIIKYINSLDQEQIKRNDLTIKEETPTDIKINNERDKLKTEVSVLIASKQEELASEKIVVFIKKYNFIYTTRSDIKSEIWIYEEGIYIPNGRTKIQELVRKVLGILYTPQRSNKVIAKIEADTGKDEKEFFSTNYINQIPVLNGILDLETKVLSPFSPFKIFFNKIPIEYDKDCLCPNIDKFLEDILKSPEDKKVIFELFGYSLYKEHFIEKAIMLVGDGRNGKSKLISLFKHFLGAGNCCSVPLSQMSDNSTGICELFNKMVNLAGDLSNTALKDTGLFKGITGRDLITAKRKYLTDLSFENYSKQIFACNELPRVYDMSMGFWSRWILFEFPFKFVTEKEYKNSKDKTNLKIRNEQIIKDLITKKELSGLLNKALEGLDKILAKGDFSNTKGTKEVKDFWIRKADSFNAFCMDCIKEDSDSYITKKSLRSLFHKYAKSHKLKSVSDKVIKINLENNFGVTEERKTILNEAYIPCWIGIKLKGKKTDCEGCEGNSKSTVILNSGIGAKPPSIHSIVKKTFNLNDILPYFDNDSDKCMIWLNKSLSDGLIIESKPNIYQKVSSLNNLGGC